MKEEEMRLLRRKEKEMKVEGKEERKCRG